MKTRVSISWSGGKDSAFALYKILLSGEYDVVSLHTVVDAESRRVGMHGVHEELIEAQSKALGIPLTKLYLRASDNHDQYKSLMLDFYRQCFRDKIGSIVFGDIFLEDLKVFRDELLKNAGLVGIYPLWKIESSLLVQDFLKLGFKTMVCCVKGNYFSKDTAGKVMDMEFTSSLPVQVDAAGENGEFHTFVFDGPIFQYPLVIERKEIVEKTYQFSVQNADGSITSDASLFYFCELSLV